MAVISVNGARNVLLVLEAYDVPLIKFARQSNHFSLDGLSSQPTNIIAKIYQVFRKMILRNMMSKSGQKWIQLG